MTIESLEILQRQKKKEPIPSGSNIEQALLFTLNQAVILLTEICIELKQWRMHE